MLHAAYEALEAIYASAKPDAEKLAEKQAVLDRLRARLRYTRPINNATLIQYRTYNSGQEELGVAARGVRRRLAAVLASLEGARDGLAPEGAGERRGRLVAPLIEARCPGSQARNDSVSAIGTA